MPGNDNQNTKTHLQKLKDIYKKLNPTADKKEISYLANLRKTIKEMEDNLHFQELVFQNIDNLHILEQK
jgi:phosphopentomutase